MAANSRPGLTGLEPPQRDHLSEAAALTSLTPLDGAATFTVRGLGTMGRVLSFGMLGRARRAQLERMRMPAPCIDPADPPWCGPGSASWIIHADPSLPVAGVLALWTQALHPLALAGVMEHSDFEEHPIRRAVRTGRFVHTTTFASGSEAELACAKVRAVHEHVVGTAPDGRPYRAGDPELVDWVHCALLLSVARLWLLYGNRPDPRLLDRYVSEQARVPRELGDDSPPTSWGELVRRIDEHRSCLAVNEQTRWIGAWLARPGLPGTMRVVTPAYRLLHTLAIAAAPGWVRSMWGTSMPVLPVRAAGKLLLGGMSSLAGPYLSPSAA